MGVVWTADDVVVLVLLLVVVSWLVKGQVKSE